MRGTRLQRVFLDMGILSSGGGATSAECGGFSIELFRNKRQGKLSSKKAMEEASEWVYASETSVR